MTKKELRKVEEVVEKVLHEMLEENYIDDDDESTIPIRIIDEMEEYLGESITFMGIS
tara:strand:- start:60 stop:230 length:171 start_codon:yes stop_codon:yes gene_type:complete